MQAVKIRFPIFGRVSAFGNVNPLSGDWRRGCLSIFGIFILDFYIEL